MSADIPIPITEGIINSSINIHHLIQEARNEYQENGFYIARNLIDQQVYKECREASLNYFTDVIASDSKNLLPYALRGDVPVGIKDFIGFSQNKSWHIYRYCHFLWNRPIDSLSLVFKTSFALSQIRNLINCVDISYGGLVENNNYITYSSLSLYPSEGGYLAKHRDHQPTSKNPSLLHAKLELTHKGSDYKEGGFYFYDRSSKKIDVSSMVERGDVIFFDGTQPHEILPITNGNIGRIAVFEIPTYVRKSSRVNSYSGDGFSFSRKVLTKIASLLP